MQIKPFKSLLILICLFSIIGCSGGQRLPDSFVEYQTRMFRVLSLNKEPIDPSISITFPSVENRKVAIPSVTIPLRDFYAINGCELASLIAQRNTALGKVEYPSRRIVYEAQLRDTLKDCIALLESTPEFDESSTVKSGLENVLAQKQDNFPRTWANLIQNSESIRLALSFDQRFIQGDPTDGFIETSQALQYLYDIKSTISIQHAEIEGHLAHLAQFRLPARLFRTTRYLTDGLKYLNRILSTYNDEFTCSTAVEQAQIKIFNNVMNQFFIQELQPIASSTNRYAQTLIPLLEKIVEDEHINNEMRVFLQNEIMHYDNYKTLFSEHVNELQILLNRCGLRPSAS